MPGRTVRWRFRAIASGQARALCADYTLVSATDGNHGRSLAWGAGRFGAPCRIYIHKEVSEARAEADGGAGGHRDPH